MGQKKVQRRSKVKPFIKVRSFAFDCRMYIYGDGAGIMTGRELLTLVPYTICS